jgi:hypothetical protein
MGDYVGPRARRKEETIWVCQESTPWPSTRSLITTMTEVQVPYFHIVLEFCMTNFSARLTSWLQRRDENWSIFTMPHHLGRNWSSAHPSLSRFLCVKVYCQHCYCFCFCHEHWKPTFPLVRSSLNILLLHILNETVYQSWFHLANFLKPLLA